MSGKGALAAKKTVFHIAMPMSPNLTAKLPAWSLAICCPKFPRTMILQTTPSRCALAQLEREMPGGWYLNALAAFPRFRGRGIGLALLAEADRLAARSGAGFVGLIASEENSGAVRLYQAHGYRTVCAAPVVGFKGFDVSGNWVLMRRDLTA